MGVRQKYAWGTAEEAVRHIGENYERYLVPAIGEPSARRVVEAAAPREGDRVLDVACGTGIAARLAAERVGGTGAVAGVDPTPPMLEVARSLSPGIDWRSGTAELLPFDDGAFDAVVCSLGFQFFADRAGALREMRRVLAPGGRMALCTPGPTPPLMAAIEESLVRYIGPEASAFVRGVFSVHDTGQVRRLVDQAGFADVEVTAGPLGLRVPPPADFFWQYVRSTPLAGVVARFDDGTRAALERDVVERCQPFLDGDALVMEPGLLVATGRRR